MSKPTVRIENWRIADNSLIGDAYGHPRFKDGTPVRTSTIMEIPMMPEEGNTVETMNTLYKLGKEFSPEPLQRNIE